MTATVTIPEEHKATIRALVEADPEVAQATCDIPHLAPHRYLGRGSITDELPYCGCFVGVYAWMQQCKLGNEFDLNNWAPWYALGSSNIEEVASFAGWCITKERDQAAVLYARSLLAE